MTATATARPARDDLLLERVEQLQLDLEPDTVFDRTAAFLAYRDSRTPARPYEPADAPLPF